MPETQEKGRKKTSGGHVPDGEDKPDDADETPEQLQKRWTDEFKAADAELLDWHRQAKETLARYIDDRKDNKNIDEKRTNLYTSNVVHQESTLYGKTPQSDVVRKYQDANDDAGRVAGMVLQRVLNGDIERPDDRFAASCGYSLADFLRVDFGLVKLRYEMEEKKVPAQPAVKRPDPQTGQLVEVVPAVPEHTEKTWEDVATDYVHWRDAKWSPCRVWEECRWVAFRTQMTRRQLKKRFGKAGAKVSLKSKAFRDEGDSEEEHPRFPWDRADVWECWSKEDGKVYWFVEGEKKMLDELDDPLELKDFWPCPKPLIMWTTTSRLVPKPEYLIAQDSYLAIERLTTRIDLLVGSLRALGVYDENLKELATLLEDTDENQMVPVPNWTAVVAERGGLEGVVSWFPLKQVVEVLEQLRAQRQQEIELNQQITGMADVMRGDLQDSSETLGATKMKARFASVRMQRKQDMFAKFVSDAQRIRAEIIAKRFDDDTLRARSNIDRTEDAQHFEEAVKLIREDVVEGYRIMVKPEAVSLDDFAAMKQERTEFVTAVGGFMGVLAKLPPVAMPAAPELAEVLKWYAAGFRGSTTIEAAMDRLVKKLQDMAKNPPPPDPGKQPDMSKVEAQKLKNEGDQQRIQMEAQARSKEIQEETQAEIVKQKAQAQFNIEEEQAKMQHQRVVENEEAARDEQHELLAHQRDLQKDALQQAHESHREGTAHERQLEAEERKAKTSADQLRMKGEQAERQAKIKARQKPPGGKK